MSSSWSHPTIHFHHVKYAIFFAGWPARTGGRAPPPLIISHQQQQPWPVPDGGAPPPPPEPAAEEAEEWLDHLPDLPLLLRLMPLF